MVPADSGRVSRARPYSGTEEGSSPCRLRDCHPLWCSVPGGFGYGSLVPCLRPHDPARCPARFRLVPVRSPLLRESRLLSSPPGTEMFQFPGLLGHSGIDARWAAPPDLSQPSTPALMTPRHPPRALRSLTTPTRRPHPPLGKAPPPPGARSRPPAVPRPARLAASDRPF